MQDRHTFLRFGPISPARPERYSRQADFNVLHDLLTFSRCFNASLICFVVLSFSPTAVCVSSGALKPSVNLTT